jgi:hypothetical protein
MQVWTIVLISWSALGLISYVCVLCFLRPMPLIRPTPPPKEVLSASKPSRFVQFAVILIGLPLGILFSPFLLVAWAWHRLRHSNENA